MIVDHHLFSESESYYPIYACNMQNMTYDGAATFTQFWLVCFTGDWICPCRYLDFLVWPFCICQTQSFTFSCFGAGVLDFSRNKFCIFHVQSSTFSDRWHPHLSEFLVWLVTVCFVKKRKPSFKMGYKVKMWMIGHRKYKTCFGRNPVLQLQNTQMWKTGFDKCKRAKPGNPDIGRDKSNLQ